MVSLVAIAQQFFSNPSIAASRVFVDDFEGQMSSAWQKDDYRDMCKVVTTTNDGGRPYSGNQMLRCNWNGLVAWNDPASVETQIVQGWNYSSEILWRFWIRIDTDATDYPAGGPKVWKEGRDHNSMCAGDFKGNGIESCNFFTLNSRQIAPNYWGGGSSIQTTAWHKYEIYVKNSSGSGVIKIWVDDNQVYSQSGIDTTQDNGGWDSFTISSNWSGAAGCCDHDASNHIYWDKFEIYSDTGTGAVGSLSDGTISVSEQAPSASAVAPPNPPIPQ